MKENELNFYKKPAEKPVTEDSFMHQEQMAETQWDKRYLKDKEEALNREPDKAVLDLLKKYEKEFKDGKVLDLGCGSGRYLRDMAKAGFDMHGMDISEEALVQLKESLEKDNISADIIKGSIYDLPYKEKSFDCIISINSLQHNDWKGAEKSFSEVSRVLKNDGLLLLSVRLANRDLPDKRKNISDKGITFIPEEDFNAGIMLHHYSREEIEELASSNSLEVLEIKENIKYVDNQKRGTWIIALRKIGKEQDTLAENNS